jgi:hypothetical protein
MKRGPANKPQYVRYLEAGRTPAVYLVEVGECIKVGFASNPFERLRGLHASHAKDGEAIGRFVLLPNHDEEKCICALHAAARPLRGCREYFTGIGFDEAVNVLRTVKEEAHEGSPSKPRCKRAIAGAAARRF